MSLLNFSPFFIVRYVRSSAGVVYIGHSFFFFCFFFFCCFYVCFLHVLSCDVGLTNYWYMLRIFRIRVKQPSQASWAVLQNLKKKKMNGEGRYRKHSISSSCTKHSSSCITHHSANLLDILALKFTANLHRT